MYSRRSVLKGASVLLAAPWLEQAMLAVAQNPVAGNPVDGGDRDPLSYVNPELRSYVAKLPPAQVLNTNLIRMARARTKSTPPPPLLTGVTEHRAPGPKGSPDVPVYVVGDSPGASKPGILRIHGGGYVALSGVITHAETDLAKKLDCVVVSVDYRLAPETQFPGSLEDNYAALRWMFENAKHLGVDTSRIAVKGESAGGGHAAMLTLAVRERKEFSFSHQVLIYPMLDDRTGSTRSEPLFLGHFIWPRGSNRFGWESLLGIPAGSKAVPANSVPARVESLAGLPPAFIGVGSIDLFAPEDIDYARRLLEAGIATELLVVPGAYHAFDILCPDASLSVEFQNSWTKFLRRGFAGDGVSPKPS